MTIRPWMLAALLLFVAPAATPAQPPTRATGEVVPRDVREMYDRGLQYLASSQSENGTWTGGADTGPGGTGIALMAFLASGEDPNFGLYSTQVRRALRSIVGGQDAQTGFLGGQDAQTGIAGRASMYHHGFAMLALAEAYGAVDERTVWPDGKAPRTIGQALELAVRAAVTSQKTNPFGGWRYSPTARDADTSVSGAVAVGLLAARNAGIEVPDESVDKAVAYYTTMTSAGGDVAYAGIGAMGDSVARTSIAALVYALARRRDLPQFKATLGNLTGNLEQTSMSYLEYARYYQAQALFQGDVEAWEKWNKLLVRQLKQAQNPDGSFRGQYGPAFSTSICLRISPSLFLPSRSSARSTASSGSRRGIATGLCASRPASSSPCSRRNCSTLSFRVFSSR